MQIINSSQDFVDETMYYTVQQQGQNYLLSSDRKYIPFWLCTKSDIQLTTHEVSQARASSDAIKKFIEEVIEVDPLQLYKSILDYISAYIYFRDTRIYALLTLWVMGTYVFRVFRYFPYIHLNAEKGSGKTTLMEILAAIAFNGDLFTDATGAAICEEIHNNAATLFLDEVEHLTADSSNMIMRILKSGFSKSGKIKRKGRFYSTYSPKMFAGINEVDDVLADRMIRVRMVKKLPSEQMKRYYQSGEVLTLQSQIVDCLYMFGLTKAKAISDIYSGGLDTTSSHLENRSWDIWSPLLSIASLIGEGLDDMIELSKELVADKEDSSNMENESTKLINVLNAMLVDLTPVKTSHGINYYDADLVFSYFCAQDYFTNGESRTSLSRLLQRKLSIRCEPQKYNGMVVRMYVISPNIVSDYARRYLPGIIDLNNITNSGYKKLE